jgi:predicted DNA-binding protein
VGKGREVLEIHPDTFFGAMRMSKIKIEPNLYERVKAAADKAGYPSADEFVVHIIEKELSVIESADSDEEVTERLRGLGYLE